MDPKDYELLKLERRGKFASAVILASGAAIGVALGSAIPVSRTIDLYPVVHKHSKADEARFATRAQLAALAGSLRASPPKASEAPYVAPKDVCGVGERSTVVAIEVQGEGESEQTWMTLRPLNRNYDVVCVKPGGWGSIFQIGQVVAVDSWEAI